MDRHYFNLRERLKKRRYQRKRIHKEWVGFGTGLRAVALDLWIAFQLFLLAVAYSLLVHYVPVAFYVCLCLTAITLLRVVIFERDIQSKISWSVLFLLSFGGGFIIYILSRSQVCFAFHKRKYGNICKRVKPYEGGNDLSDAPKTAVESYLNGNGFRTYRDTEIKYYGNARQALDNMIARVDGAKKFVFIEFFIVADGVFLERLISIFRRKTAEGVKIFMTYDDVGCAGVFSEFVKGSIRDAGVKLKAFHPLFSPFYFGLNYRDHRKIVVVDGQTAYCGGYNLIDDCANQRIMEGVWKDSGVRVDGAAVDGFSLQFIKQWEFATGEKLDPREYLNNYTPVANAAKVIPYAGGPEMSGYICRGVYHKIISEAREKLFIMTPYLVPDSDTMKLLAKKAAEGVDVRLVLPGVPDYRYIYRITVANADKLIKKGVKVYYSGGEFVHSKVMLTENVAAVGSVNMDMRAFYQEFDNGVVTDDSGAMEQIASDFEWLFGRNEIAAVSKFNAFNAFVTGALRLISPLM